MKKALFLFFIPLLFALKVDAQIHYKKNGTPDMRYKENKQFYGNSYSTQSYSTPSYNNSSYNSTPNYNYTTPSNSYPSSTYSYPSNSYPKSNKSIDSYFDTYPNKKDGTPDMRYNSNKKRYGYIW